METTCQACGSESLHDYGNHRWDIGGVQYRLTECDACKTIFTNPLPDDAILTTFYETGFRYDWYLDYYGAKVLDVQMRLDEYQGLLGKRVLDFGGGLGYFSLVCRLRGHEAVTYDPYTTGNVPAVGSWDSVVALHVLEHANQPGRMLDRIRTFLAPGANLLLAVPNRDGCGYQAQGMGWVWAQPPMLHLFHFSTKGLLALLERHGFAIDRVSYHERWDANRVNDVEEVETIRRMEREWWEESSRNAPDRRALIAWRNAECRFEALRRSLEGFSPDDTAHAELHVVARPA